MNQINATISQILSSLPLRFDWGVCRLSRPLSIDLYRSALEAKLHGSQTYLQEHRPYKESPSQILEYSNRNSKIPLRSAIVLSIDYENHPFGPQKKLTSLKTARYAQGEDYHIRFKECLRPILSNLESHFPDENFYFFVDSSPVLERDLAYRAGLGWIGKNTCLIQKGKGSFRFIAEIYTSLDLENHKELSADYCGTCSKCIEACPTGALEPRRLDSKKCISFLTIEDKSEEPQLEFRKQIGTWILGCDICQEVCPWNQPLVKVSEPKSKSQLENQIEELRWILASSGKQLQRELSGTPFARIAGHQLKRNALIVAANLKAQDLETQIQLLMDHPRLGKLARWTLSKIKENY